MRYAIDGRHIQDHFPGIGRYAFNLARHLPELSPQDEFIVLVDPQAVNTRFDLSLLGKHRNVTLLPTQAAAFAIRQQVVLPRLMRTWRIDLYHSPYYVTAYHMPCHRVVTIHDLIPFLHPGSLPNPRLRMVFSLLMRLAASRADTVITDSESSRGDLLKVMPSLHDRVTSIPLGVGSAFRPASKGEPDQPQRRFGLLRPYALYLGMNKPHKNLGRLVEAWAALPSRLRDTHLLVLAGREDPRYSLTRRRVTELGLSSSVRFLGAIATSDLPALYAGAKCFVFPSLSEGFGLPVLEAMACGTPVACSNTSSLPELVGNAALTFDPDDVAAIQETLRRLLTEQATRQCLIANGLARAGRFTWRETAARTLDAYRRAVQRRP